MRIRKFEPGDPITTLDQLVAWCRTGGYVFWHKKAKPTHGSFIMGLRLNTAAHRVASGELLRANIRAEWAAAQKREDDEQQ